MGKIKWEIKTAGNNFFPLLCLLIPNGKLSSTCENIKRMKFKKFKMNVTAIIICNQLCFTMAYIGNKQISVMH